MSEFTVEISRPGEFGALTSASLELPATWAEYQDAMEKARVTDDRVIYSVEVCDIKRRCLDLHIGNPVNLLELNLLAQRMGRHIRDEMDVFDAMVSIETKRHGGPIPLPRLINLTFSTENCHVAGNIGGDTQLGKFLYDNDFLSDEDAGAVRARGEAGRPVSDLLALLGKEHRANEGGVFTDSGRYVEFDGSVNEVYVPGEMAYFDRSGAPVVLELSKDGNIAVLDLPGVYLKKIAETEKTLGVEKLDECSYRCADCLIPAAKEWIDAARDIKAVSQFARELDYMEHHGGVVEYKALLETAGCADLDTALRLTEDIDAYRLAAECSGPEDYAREALAKLEYGADICRYVNLYGFGQAVMKQNNVAGTSYGLLSRKDGGPILSQADQPHMTMEMR